MASRRCSWVDVPMQSRSTSAVQGVGADCAPGEDQIAPRNLWLGHLAELTRLVLKGHVNLFGIYTADWQGPSVGPHFTYAGSPS